MSSSRPPSASKITKPPSRPPSASQNTNVSTGPRISSASSRLRATQNNLSFEVNAEQKAQDRIRTQSDDEREQFIINVFHETFGDAIRNNEDAFRSRFRKMAENPFNFYRGSAVLFYYDLKIDQDPWIARNQLAGNIFIHGDLHAENFGTYMDSHGILHFDVNDFDEGYCGPFTWDVKRLLASLYIVAYTKGFSNDTIRQILTRYADTYVKQVYEFCNSSKDQLPLTLKQTTGKIQLLLKETRIQSHVEHLAKMTVIENYERKFKRSIYTDVDAQLYKDINDAFQTIYLESIPEPKKNIQGPSGSNVSCSIKDIVKCSSKGIGSAGTESYTILLEGPTEALENDIVLSMKQALPSAVSCVVKNSELEKYFEHHGLRTVLCSYAMQASTPQWLGYTTLHGKHYLVDEVSTHSKGLSWSNINDLKDILEVVTYLGKVTAKIHCVADSDCTNLPKNLSSLPLSIIPRDTETTIRDAIGGQDDEFINDMVNFGMTYGKQVYRDHRIFSDAVINDRISRLEKKE
ncbi:unnamed protein product [Rotaria sordida]|uniref:DUF2252 domain-containing protein n=1 Tax=Rotaria sordida TaxID=392033 RepID=A0A814UGD9_9BILA|nr:unnamed protein product [Rotaria sordida]CAF1430962.1 unnamed protein product [Rotaria sordida]